MILLNDPSKVDNLLLLLTRHLERYGLRVNQKIVTLWKTPELIEHRCRRIQAIFAANGDNQKPELIRKFVDAYLSITHQKLATTWNGGTPLLNRLLWAKLDSLPRNLINKVMVCLTAEPFLLQASVSKLNRLSDLNALRLSPIDLNKRLLTIAAKSEHNAFHHEVLVYSRKVRDVALEQFLKNRIDELDHLKHANIIDVSKNLTSSSFEPPFGKSPPKPTAAAF